MIYKFGDMNEDELYKSNVFFICGSHAVFNNVVVDRVRAISKAEVTSMLGDVGDISLSELGIEVDYKLFMENVSVPPLIGKWYCKIAYEELTKAQWKKLEEYMKKPSKYGRLIVEVTDFKNYKSILNSKVVKSNKDIGAIKLSYPSTKDVREMVERKTEGIKIAEKAMDLLLIRMSDKYDEYDNIINIIVDSGEKIVDYDMMRELLKGVENYVLDDVVKAILRAPTNERGKKRVYGIVYVMKEEVGAVALCKMIKRKINTLIKLRSYINAGYIPGKLKYSVSDFKDKLDTEDEFKKMNDYVLRKYIEMAMITSLRDLQYIGLILGKIYVPEYSSNKNDKDKDKEERKEGRKEIRIVTEEQAEIMLMRVMNRALVSGERLMYTIGVKSSIKEEIGKRW